MNHKISNFCRFSISVFYATTFLLANSLHSADSKHKFPKISFRVAGEVGFISIGDINTGLRTFNDNPAFREIRGTQPSSAGLEGNIKSLNGFFGNGEAELRIDFPGPFGLGLAVSGAEIKRRNESILRFFKYYQVTEAYEYSYKPEIMMSAPFKMSLYYYWRRGAKVSFYFNGGVGYYGGKMSEQYDLRILNLAPLYVWTKRHWETEWNSTLGWHVGAGMELRMGRKVSAFAELQGRYARIGKFRATQQYETSFPLYEETTGWLYYFTRENLFVYGIRQADMEVWESPPDASIDYIADVRKARLDLSGLSVKVGLRVMLF